MADWVKKADRRREINEYFSSINCMCLRIVEDTEKIRQNYGKSWNNFSVKEQEQRIDEWMVPAEVRKQYPLPEEERPEVYPTLRLDTGQKIVELQVNHSEFPQTWMDEHSEPYSLQSRSQMDIRLPAAKEIKKKSSLEEHENLVGEQSVEADDKVGGSNLNGGFFGLRSSNFGAKNGSALENFGKATDAANSSSSIKYQPENSVQDFGADIKLEFGRDYDETGSYNATCSAGAKPITFQKYEAKKNPTREELPDISFGGDFFESYDSAEQNDDVSKIEVSESKMLPSSGLSKAYDESEFLDLYPQPKEDQQRAASHELFGKSKETKTNASKSRKNSAKKAPKLPENPPPIRNVNPAGITRPNKTHRKKSSSGSNQVNPRSSLTLDGAIFNLEIAAEMNKQGASPQVHNEKVFGDEEDLLKQIDKDTDLDSWLTDNQNHGSNFLSSRTEDDNEGKVQKSGFDFLDSW